MKLSMNESNFTAVVTHDDGSVAEFELTNTEWRLLKYLCENSDRVVTKDELLEKIWDKKDVTRNTVEVYVKYLRMKLWQGVIITRTGYGYRIAPGILGQ